jgi:hypothetical protein
MRQLALAFVVLGLASCGDNPAAPDMAIDMSMPDLAIAHDLAVPPDFGGVACGAMTCSIATQECCLTNGAGGTQAACGPIGSCNGDAGGSLRCDGPEDCSTASPDCCIDINGTASADAGIGGGTGDASCSTTGACKPSAMFANGAFTARSKLCHTNDDCKNYSGMVPLLGMTPFDACCSSAMAGPYKFCAPSAATAIPGTGLTCN